MIKILKTVLLLSLLLISGLYTIAEEVHNNEVYKAGISVNETVPSSLFGIWKVKSTLVNTDSSGMFKKTNTDLWNISKDGLVINLSNPFSGASASVDVQSVEGNTVIFTKVGNYDGKILTDTVTLTIENEKFTGKNKLQLQTLSDIDNSVIKTVNAEYNLQGEKIAGTNVLRK